MCFLLANIIPFIFSYNKNNYCKDFLGSSVVVLFGSFLSTYYPGEMLFLFLKEIQLLLTKHLKFWMTSSLNLLITHYAKEEMPIIELISLVSIAASFLFFVFIIITFSLLHEKKYNENRMGHHKRNGKYKTLVTLIAEVRSKTMNKTSQNIRCNEML